MRRFIENHRPLIEFSDEEALAMDKEFFRKAFDKANFLRGAQTAYPHRVLEDCRPELIEQIAQVKALHSSMPRQALYDYLVNLCAHLARNARLAKFLIDEQNFRVNAEAKPDQ